MRRLSCPIPPPVVAKTLALAALSLSAGTAWAEGRAGVELNALPSKGLAIGPHASLRLDVPMVGVHVDLNGLYTQGPDTELVETIEWIDDESTGCASGLPSFWTGQTTLDGRVAMGLGLLHLRGGLSSSLQSGLSPSFMEHIARECQIAAEGPAYSLSIGPTVGVLVGLGPVETTIDLVYRAGAWGTDPYQWVDEPDQERWVRAARDYVHPTLELPIRSTVVLGPIYLQAGLTLGVDFPTQNSKLWHQQDPEGSSQPEMDTRADLAVAVGVSF